MSKRSSYSGADTPTYMSGPRWRQLGAFKVLDETGANEPTQERRVRQRTFGTLSLSKLADKDNKYNSYRFTQINARYMDPRDCLVPIAVGAGDNVWRTAKLTRSAGSTQPGPLYRFPFMNCSDAALSGPFGNSFVKANRQPVLLCNLTNCPNVVSDNTINPLPDISYPLITDEGSVYFQRAPIAADGIGTLRYDNTLQGTATGGGDDPVWQQAFRPLAATAAHPGDKAILRRSHINIELYGQKVRPTVFHVYVCQFDEDCCPGNPFTRILPTNVNDYGMNTRATGFYKESDGASFWQRLCKRASYHPDYNTYVAKDVGMKVMHYEKVSLEANNNDIDVDLPCHMVRMRLNLDFNRLCRFSWGSAQAAVDPGNSDAWNGYYQDNHTTVDPKARVFLMIVAENYYSQTAALGSDNNYYYNSNFIPGCTLDVRNDWVLS